MIAAIQAGGGLRVALAVVEGFVALTAIGGGVALALGLEADRFGPEWLEGTPFRSYLVPGLLLSLARRPSVGPCWTGSRRLDRRRGRDPQPAFADTHRGCLLCGRAAHPGAGRGVRMDVGALRRTLAGQESRCPFACVTATPWSAQFLVPAAAAQALVEPDDLEVIRLLPRRTAAILAFARYRDSDLGSYGEVAIAFLVRQRSARRQSGLRHQADWLAQEGFLAVAPDLYGGVPKDAESFLPGACPIVGSYGARDPTNRHAAEKLELALERNSVPHDIKEYPDAGHAFLNDHAADDVPRASLDAQAQAQRRGRQGAEAGCS